MRRARRRQSKERATLIEGASTRRIDIGQITLACETHHRLLDNGWTTRKHAHGDSPPVWTAANRFHHREKWITEADEDGL